MSPPISEHPVTAALERVQGDSITVQHKVNALLSEAEHEKLKAKLAGKTEAQLSRMQEEYVQAQMKKRKKHVVELEEEERMRFLNERQSAEDAKLAHLSQKQKMDWYALEVQRQAAQMLEERAQRLQSTVVTKNQELTARIIRLGETLQQTKSMTSLYEWRQLLKQARDTEDEAREWEVRVGKRVAASCRFHTKDDLPMARHMLSLVSEYVRKLADLFEQRSKHNKRADNLLRRGQREAADSTEEPIEMEYCRCCCVYHNQCMLDCPCRHVDRLLPECDDYSEVVCLVCLRSNGARFDDASCEALQSAAKLQHLLNQEKAAASGTLQVIKPMSYKGTLITNCGELAAMLYAEPIVPDSRSLSTAFSQDVRDFVCTWYASRLFVAPASTQSVLQPVAVIVPKDPVPDFAKMVSELQAKKATVQERIDTITKWMLKHLYGSETACSMLSKYRTSTACPDCDRTHIQACVRAFKQHWGHIQKGTIGAPRNGMYAVDRCQQRANCASTITMLCTCVT